MSKEIKEMRVMKDGDAWFFVLPDFENIQVSPSVWLNESDTHMDVVYEELVEIMNPVKDSDGAK